MKKKNNKHSPVSGKLKVAQQQIEVLKKEVSEHQMWQGAYKSLKSDVDEFIKAVSGYHENYYGFLSQAQPSLQALAVEWGKLQEKAKVGEKLFELEILPVNENETLKHKLSLLEEKLSEAKNALS